MKNFLRAAIVATLLVILPQTSYATDPNCMMQFYKTQDMACAKAIVEMLPQASPSSHNPGSGLQPNVLGFLTELFGTNSQARDFVLGLDVPPQTQAHIFIALRKAGLQNQADDYAKTKGLMVAVDNRDLMPLQQMRPNYLAGDNDTLIGAYGASGNIAYIRAILENFSTASDGMVSDALRMGMLHVKFGSNLAPPGREGRIAKATCQKYECKKDIKPMMRVLTLASAYWALYSLSQSDAPLKKTFVDFFSGNPRLQKLLGAEITALSNYLTMTVLYMGLRSSPDGLKANPNVEAALTAHEELLPPNAASNAATKKR